MNPTVVGIVLIVAILGYAIFSVTYKQKAGLKKAQSGEDKARVRALLEKTLPEEMPFTPIYVHMSIGRHTVNHYTYALAVQPEKDQLWVVPVGKEGDLLYPGKSFVLSLEALGSVHFSVSKDNLGKRLSYTFFYDQNREKIFSLEVKDFECREDRYHWLDVYQPEEASVFFQMMEKWAAQKPLQPKKKK